MRYLELSKTGKVRTFKGDFPQVEALLKEKREDRISHIVPEKRGLRLLWRVLRWTFEVLGYERGIQWLRGWKVRWVVIVGGREMEVFDDRARALEWEKNYFIKGGLP